MIKYRTWNKDIAAVDVIRETEKFVYLRGWNGREQRQQKRAVGLNWHDSWEAAHVFLVDETEQKIATTRNRLEVLEGRRAYLRGMKPGDIKTN